MLGKINERDDDEILFILYLINYRAGTTTSECTFLGQWTFATLKCTRK
jgi:hypothetical protein